MNSTGLLLTLSWLWCGRHAQLLCPLNNSHFIRIMPPQIFTTQTIVLAPTPLGSKLLNGKITPITLPFKNKTTRTVVLVRIHEILETPAGWSADAFLLHTFIHAFEHFGLYDLPFFRIIFHKIGTV